LHRSPPFLECRPLAPHSMQIMRMWCATCQASVGPAQSTSPGRCPNCDDALIKQPVSSNPQVAPMASAVDEARSLLDRWNKHDPLASSSTSQALVSTSPAPASPKAPAQPTDSSAATSPAATGRRLRVDKPHTSRARSTTSSESRSQPTDAVDAVANHVASLSPTSSELSANIQPLADNGALQQATHAEATPAVSAETARPDHRPPVSPPHVAPPDGSTTNPLTHSTSLWGQLIAYLGVLGLTAGGSLIVWNGFGHAPINTPTSWLIATGGQMLLFLGLIMLVSSGLEQTSEDVHRQVRALGDQLHRIENAHLAVAPRSGQDGRSTKDARLADGSQTAAATNP